MQMGVKIKSMLKIPDDMNLIQKRIHVCMLELETLSGLEEPMNGLKRQEKRLETQAGYCMLFGNTIRQIGRQYVNTENNIVDYSENVRRKAQRESLSSRNLKDLNLLFHRVIFSEGGDGIGG